MRATGRGARTRGAGMVVAALAALAAAAPLAGQAGSQGEAEGRLLRNVAILESRGELEEAAELLQAHLARRPTATGVLFALERVLRGRGRVADVLPAVDAYLAEEPASGGIRHLKLRLLVELDSLSALEEEAVAWIRAAPRDPEPYREVARVFARTLGPEKALEVLRRGSEVVEEPGSLALETGDLLLELGRVEDGARAWSRAVTTDGGGGGAVLRRVERLGGDRRDAVRLLVEALVDAGGPGRLRTAALAAVEVGLEERALEAARKALDGRPTATWARGFLLDLADRARRSSRARAGGTVAVWAYRALRERTDDPQEALSLDRRIADVATAAGDTATAVAARRRVAAGLPEGSAERRAALAAVVRLEGPEGDPAELQALLATFRSEYPDAPETDELAATLAARLHARGEREAALQALEGMEGPRSALERAYLHLEAEEVQEGRAALLEAIPGLPPTRATSLIELAGLLGKVGEAAARRAGRAAVLGHRGRPADGAEMASDVDAVPLDDRAPLLALGARLAEAGDDPARAARLRERIVTTFPDAAEWPEAALALARHLARTPEGRSEAERILEGLILERPESAVVPSARRELERLRSRRGSDR